MLYANPRVAIGVRTTSHHQRLAETILAIYETASQVSELVVLDDIQRSEVSASCTAKTEIMRVPKPGGGAASLNQLFTITADVYVMIEAGAIPAPNWLDHLMAALKSDPAIGAVGPTTNSCWNQQAAIECRTSEPRALDACAARLHHRFGDRLVSMAPVHNLVDFAFAVTRPLVEAIGLADERYLDGPCWEMDYWARAALAGWKTVWAQSAFVWRDQDSIAVASRNLSDMEASKRMYQSHFCSIQHSHHGDTPVSNCEHCYGSACSAFTRSPIEPFRTSAQFGERKHMIETADLPLISCVMPTRGRRDFVAQSVRYFQQQDYPNRELVIVYETPEDLPEIPEDKTIKRIQTSETSIGGKREIGSQASAGEILVHWDDDDWFASNRLSRQAAPILANACDISGLTGTLFFELAEQRFWSVTSELFARLFVESVQGGTLMFRREVWEKGGPYPSVSLREDIAILINGMKLGARLARVSGHELSVYLRHGRNSWAFVDGEHLDPKGWSLSSAPRAMNRDLEFYAQMRSNAAFETASRSATRLQPRLAATATMASPKLSCIMPTNNRHQYVPGAIEQFLRQDYEHRELIILDDGTTSVERLIPDHPKIRYFRSSIRQPLGDKRNAACELATGELIAHWDDDDWIAPTWLSSQIKCLQSTNADIVGINQPMFHDPSSGITWRYVYDGLKPWAAGGTLCYRRAFWAKNRFASINIGEDNLFLWSPQEKQLSINPRHDLYVARVHPGNTSPKQTSGTRWKRLTEAAIQDAIDNSILAALEIR